MLLILTDEFDSHVNYILQKLGENNLSYFRLDTNVQALKYTYVTYMNSKWFIKNKNGNVDSTSITCVWSRRPFVELMLEEYNDQSTDFRIWKNEWNKTLLGLYNSLKNVKWLNPLRKAYKGENKYYQFELAEEVGLLMPDTIVSNEKQELMNFAIENEPVVLKLMSQEIYQVNNEVMGFYVNKIMARDLESYNVVDENPIVLQRYIPKAYEVRYTVVGNKHFACRINSQQSDSAKEDWRRYDIPNTPHLVITPPDEIRNKVNELLSLLHIEYGALDFVVTPDNEWVFLEINCMGQWLWIENLTGLNISDAIIEWISDNIN